MAYTQAQLTASFTNATTGQVPTAAQSLALQALATQNAAGQLTDAQALDAAIALGANSTTAVGVQTYQFFAGFAPSVAGVTALNAAYATGGSQANLNAENRFIAQSVALATQNTAAKTAFAASYGTLSVVDATKAAYNIIIGAPAATAANINIDAAVAYLTRAENVTYLTNFIKANTALTAAADIDLAVKAAIVGQIMQAATSYNGGVGLGAYAQATDKLLADLADNGALVADNAAGINLFTNYGSVNTGGGVTLALTAGTDVFSPTSAAAGSKSTSGNDTIYALGGTLATGDIVDAGDGVDVLNASYTAVAANSTVSPILTGVERLNITGTDGAAGTTHTSTFELGASKGLSEVVVTYSGSTDGTEDVVTLNGLGLTTAVGVSGGDIEYNLNAVFSGVTGTNDTATIAAMGGSVGNLTAAGIENVKIVASGGSTTLKTLTVAAAKTLTVSGDKNVTITDNIDFADNAAGGTAIDGTIDASGLTAGRLTFTSNAGDTIKATAGAGGLTATTGAGNDVLTGAGGSDRFTIGGGDDTVSTGAGDDWVAVAVADLSDKDSIALGDGTDELRLDVAALNATGVDAAKLALVNKVTGLEIIGTSGTASAIDAGYFTQSIFALNAAAAAGGLAITNVAGDTVKFRANAVSTGTFDGVTISGALPNQSVTLELNGAAAVRIGADDSNAANNALTIASGVSTVNIISNTGSATAVTNLITLAAATTATHTIDNASAGSFVLTGATDLTINSGLTAGFTKAVDFNATAFTGKLSIVGSVEADIIKGGSGADTLNGHDGDDVLTGGAGADTFVFASGQGSAAPSTTVFETITDYAKGSDIIDFDQALTIDTASAAAVATVAQVSAQGIATFHADDDTLAEKIVAASKGFDADGDFVVFEHAGDTYVLISGDANATQDAADAMIKLVGVTGVTSSTIDAGGNLILG